MSKFIIGIIIVIILGAGYLLLQSDSTPDSAYRWVGTYEYSEFGPSNSGSNQTWVYQLIILSDEGQLGISLNIDGFQTLVRIMANAIERDGKLDIVFEDYGSDNLFPQYEKGEALLSLEKVTEEKYKILWGAMASYLQDPGDAQFLKKNIL